ncbi:C4-dicarboxylate TRAP transporter substrate-binding protein DctB [Bacillus spizizenii ATCC 6633 = JCM 2499]|uniref:C4-dicarboxylate binding protein n=1 Tax=Bacillus spizizenii (strain ATCC 23059 / NRRL B-14472 / W23) TaxID=655816 RepID=E0U358_BACSH|nr:C4-dicarboxylate TRAP transporter substrate-binding protein DctB [Bacillus spizizenii]QCJ15833.1 C4-dicarboxylate TRAP transporter substrate-binding protein DctB [Bacillus subtilis]ADM36519.1 C4-dicarboxylate binding protein [Bacillus spizizenii str. W23]AJW85965.1 C4-dicarboxylate ABC transporter [Bacillus spizizenii]EFG90979.1 C4-dicarboxylate binding protein [Bacillus spizizenii ATCC 6633 = JCM 2499]KFK79154.1 TRAP transporter solute receptor, DctP family protein [Bacillus spizizenii]
MKSLLACLALMIAGIATALFIGFHDHTGSEEIVYDDDQEGLQDQIVFTFSHVVAENTPKGLAANKFAELVNEKSGGKIKIEVFPNGSLYSDIEEIEALQNGDVQFIAPSTSKLGMLSSEWGVLDLPYAFTNYDAVKKGLNGSIGTQLFDSLKKNQLKGLAYWTNGFKQITTNQGPVRDPDDLKGQDLRIMQSDVIEDQFKLLGATPHQESFNSTFQLLENNIVDGEENTISNIYSKKFYNVQDYLTISSHGYLGYAVMTEEHFWNAQTSETRRILTEAMKETTEWNETYAEEMNKEQLEEIKKNSSIKIYELSDKEKKEWMKRLDPVYRQYEPIFGRKLIRELLELREDS